MFFALYAYLAFFSIALPDSMLGVAWPAMSISFGSTLGAAGLIPPVGVAATLVSTMATHRVVARIGLGQLLVLSTLLSAAGLIVGAVSPTLPVFLVGVVLIGLSGGAIDVALNSYAARRFGPRQVSLMHAAYVVGAAVSPLLVTAALQTGVGWRLPYVIVAAAQVLLAGIFATRSSLVTSPGPTYAPAATRRWQRDGPSSVAAWLGAAVVFVQTAIESSLALWSYSYLTLAAGVTPLLAGLTASGFWLMMFAGRVGLGAAAKRIGTWTAISLAAAGLLVAGVLVALGLTSPAVAVAGVLLFGAACGPLYPLLVLTTAERTTPAGIDRLVALQAAASSIGAATMPAVVGVAMTSSPANFALVVPAAAGVAAALYLALGLIRRSQ